MTILLFFLYLHCSTFTARPSSLFLSLFTIHLSPFTIHRKINHVSVKPKSRKKAFLVNKIV